MTASGDLVLRQRTVLGAIAIALGLLFLLPALIAWVVLADDIQQAKTQLVDAQTLLARKPALEQELQALRLRAQTGPGLVGGATPALAQAELADDMKAIIDANNGVLVSAQMLAPSRRGHFDLVSIAYDVTIPLSRVKSFLYAVETHAPYFFFDDADMQMPPNWRADMTQTPDPMLEVHCTVHAYRWNGAA